MKKLFSQAYVIVKEEKWKSLLIMSIVAIFIIVFNIVLGFLMLSNEKNNSYNESKLQNKYFISINDMNYNKLISPKKRLELFNNIEANLNNKSLSYEIIFWGKINENENITANVFCGDAFETICLPLKDGSGFTLLGNNEIILGSNYSSNYKVGDKIPISVNLTSGKETIDFTVVGILKKDSYAFTLSTSAGSYMDLSSIFENSNDMCFIRNPSFDIENLTDSAIGTILFWNEDEELSQELLTPLNNYGYVFQGQELKNNDKAESNINIFSVGCIAITLFLATLLSIGISNSMLFYNKSTEFAAYYLSGASQLDCLKLIVYRSAIILMIPMIVSFAALEIPSIRYIYGETNITGFSYLITIVIVIISMLVTSIPVFLKIKKTSPSDFFREVQEK